MLPSPDSRSGRHLLNTAAAPPDNAHGLLCHPNRHTRHHEFHHALCRLPPGPEHPEHGQPRRGPGQGPALLRRHPPGTAGPQTGSPTRASVGPDLPPPNPPPHGGGGPGTRVRVQLQRGADQPPSSTRFMRCRLRTTCWPDASGTEPTTKPVLPPWGTMLVEVLAQAFTTAATS